MEVLGKFSAEIDRIQKVNCNISLFIQIYGMFSLFSCLSQLYQEQCQDPPLGFNMPPMSGKIAWSRQLFRHIEQPMELLKVQEFLLGTSQGRSVVRKYNRIALVLTEYEILHYQRWVDIVEIGQKNLQVIW